MQARQQQQQEDWQTEWRKRVDGEIEKSAELHAQAAVTFERLNGRMTAAEQDIAEIRNARRKAPEEFRGWLLVMVAFVALAPAYVCGGLSLLLQVLPHLH